MAQQAVRITIHGKVQGVFFRNSLMKFAQDLGVVGSVRNLPDGTVVVNACGDELVMTNFINYCKQGNGMARVDAVDIESIPVFAADQFIIEE